MSRNGSPLYRRRWANEKSTEEVQVQQNSSLTLLSSSLLSSVLIMNATYAYSKAGPAWGFPPGSLLTDTVPDDMKAMIHPHWSKFPPVNPMWHVLLGILYLFIGSISISGESQPLLR